MKSQPYPKLIHYLFTRKFVIVIIGILSAIAFPSFITSSCACKPGSEAKVYLGSINRAQQAYFLESGKFSPTINQLEIGIQEDTERYKYSTKITKNSAFNYGIAKLKYLDKNNFFDEKPLYSFVAAVFIVQDPKINEKKTITIICQNDVPGTIKPNNPTLKNGIPTCVEGTTDININTKR